MNVSLSFTFANGNAAITSSFSESTPTVIRSWHVHTVGDACSTSRVPDGAAVGCEDGSLYFFRSSTRAVQRRISTGSLSNAASSPKTKELPSPRSPRHLSQHNRRSLSPASSTRSAAFSPFQVSKPRVVSSVSTELAEAPKNYVDFEDEQAKMKGMVKRKTVKDKTVVDSLMVGTEKTLMDKSTTSSTTASTRQSISEDRLDVHAVPSVPSTSISRSSSTRSMTSPMSPTVPQLSQLVGERDPFVWSLVCHTIPPHTGTGAAVQDMVTLEKRAMILCLHQSGHIEAYSTEDGSCIAAAHVEGGSFPVPTGAKANSKLPAIWLWKKLQIIPAGESDLVLITGSPEFTSPSAQSFETSNGDQAEETRVVSFELRVMNHGDPEGIKLEKVGDCSFMGPAGGVVLCQDVNRDHLLFHIDPLGHLIRQTLLLVRESSLSPSNTSRSNSATNLALPNPFKALKGLRSSDNLPAEAAEDDRSRIRLSDTHDLGQFPLQGSLHGMRFFVHDNALRAAVWDNASVDLVEVSYTSIPMIASLPITGLQDVRWTEESTLIALREERAEVYRLSRVGHKGTVTDSLDEPRHKLEWRLANTISLLPSDTYSLSPVGSVLATRTRSGRRRLYYYGIEDSGDIKPRTLWKARREDVMKPQPDAPRVTCILPIELGHIVLAFSDGYIARTSLQVLMKDGPQRSSGSTSDVPLQGSITAMQLVRNDSTGECRVVGGADDGSLAIWSLDTLKVLARWTVFLEPLAEVIYLSSGRFRGSAFCIAGDGTVALIAVDGCQFWHLVPASVAPLERICLGEGNLLLYYGDSRARLWDTKTWEFWRSMTREKADEMLEQGGWTQWQVGLGAKANCDLASISRVHTMPDAAATLTFDLEPFLLHVGTGTLPPGARSSEFLSTTSVTLRRDNIRAVLSALLTFSLNEEIDRLCETLHIHKSNVGVGVSAHGATTMYVDRGARGPWLISPEVTAVRASAIVALLHALQNYEPEDSNARTVTVYYTASLAQAVGPAYKAPNLAVLALQWLRAEAPELRNASRLRFEAGIVRLMDEEVIELVDAWQGNLPCIQADALKDATRSAMSLFICGTVAIEKYKLLQTTCLTDIAKSIALYLHDEASPYRALAIDLCSRGFPVWQQYVDAVEMLRALFTLATSSKKEGISMHNVGQQARTAVLQIASGNTPLFMTTLSIDILQPKSVQHRKSVMQLVIFLIHKKPMALFSNLPRLVEAVVKSLDPNANASREAVLDSAAEILGHIVETYPTVDFHGPTQRLAVGTSEGAVVMYDLKTATRLYVLEGHKKRTTACSFSPDGRRLMTLSLDESMVLIWKVGSSFTSFFMPGAPPRQGHSGSEPYKTFPFNIADEGVMTLAETFELIRFEWTGDRSVKLKIRNAVLTFST